MSSLLKDAKEFYSELYERGQWKVDLNEQVVGANANLIRRLGIIRKIYEIILSSKKSTTGIVKWVTSSLSINAVAELLDENPSNLKSELWYFNQTIGSKLEVNGISILRKCIIQKNMSDQELMEMEEIVADFISNNELKLFYRKRLLDNKNLLVNIPAKSELHRNISDTEFDSLLEVIKPYFISQRKLNQQFINNSSATGYMNYIMTEGAELNELDKIRKNKVLALLEGKEQEEITKTNISATKENMETAKKLVKPIDDEVIDFGGYETIHIKF